MAECVMGLAQRIGEAELTTPAAVPEGLVGPRQGRDAILHQETFRADGLQILAGSLV